MFALFSEFPYCVGAIDGTQIPLKAPWVNPEQYWNHHKFFSIATQLVVNHHGAVTHLSCCWPGSVHDSRVLNESFLQEVLDQNVLGKYYLLGDAGYSCQYNLLTPYPRFPKKLTEEEKHYNKCLSKTRVKVECVIGQMKNKFACLKNTSHYQPDIVCNVIKACVFLWNFGLLTGDNIGYNPDQYVIEDADELDQKLSEVADKESGQARHEVLKNYLWQHKTQR